MFNHVGLLLPLFSFLHIEMEHCGASRRWSLKINQLSWTPVFSGAVSHVILVILCNSCNSMQCNAHSWRSQNLLFGKKATTVSRSLQPVLPLSFTSHGPCMVSSTAFPIVGSSITSVRKLPSVLFRNPSWNIDSHCWFQPFPMLNMSVAAISLCKLLDHFTRPNFWTPSWNDVMWRAACKRRLCEACTKVQPITHLTCWVLFPPLFSRLNVK